MGVIQSINTKTQLLQTIQAVQIIVEIFIWQAYSLVLNSDIPARPTPSFAYSMGIDHLKSALAL
jgi:hypothetical protein